MAKKKKKKSRRNTPGKSSSSKKISKSNKTEVEVEAYNTKMQQQGLFGSKKFDPQQTYALDSRTGSIRNWKDIGIVMMFFVLIIGGVLFTVINLGYVENPLDQETTEELLPVSNNEPAEDLPKRLSDDIDVTLPDGKFLYLDSPDPSEPQEGIFFAFGLASSSLVDLKLDIYDRNGNHLASEDPIVAATDFDVSNWSTYVNIINSPYSEDGFLVLKYETSEKEYEERLPIRFEKNEGDYGLQIVGPIPEQLSNNKKVEFYGNANSFAGNKLDVVLSDDKGVEISKGEVDIDTDGKLTGEIQVPYLDIEDATRGNWEIMDGSLILLRIPVRFHENF